MQMESQISLDSEVHLHPGNTPVQDEDPHVASSVLDNVMLQQSAKRPTRQWAAWTREEEESFFTALRQVGKNFEKITHRVRSKNKDQVRHYYYRLVRRMNKLLGPGLCLDAKNSKDTNAAMLRWWSLLEKYSCKASKLHLKPRRFKIFVEALELQLQKDRKRNVRRRSSLRESYSPPAPSSVSNQSRTSGQDTCTVKLVLVDNQNIQKIGPAKGSLKRNVSIGVNRSNNKGDSATVKPARQRRIPDSISSAAYKKWEKAAIAGVSLVADAAEHLERTSTDKEVELDQGPPEQKAIEPVDKVPPSLSTISQTHFAENNVQTPVKLKLQLYPIDDGTRRALEMDNHNPHLELTLSTRKKISSVLEHLNKKWGNSSVASGELMLFPYCVQRENLVGHQRWTQDSVFSAADIYGMIGSPSLFRLRYGWFSDAELGSVTLQAPSASSCVPSFHDINVKNRKEHIVDAMPTCVSYTSDQPENYTNPYNKLISGKENQAFAPSSNVPIEMSRYISPSKGNIGVTYDPAANLSWPRKETGIEIVTEHVEDVGDERLSSGTAPSAGEWADSLTNISVGDLLSEVPRDVDTPPVPESFQCLQQIPFSCDSFDAAIAAHISRHQNKMGAVSTLASHASSIWDAEETCDAFSFQTHPILCNEVSRFPDIAPPADCKQIARTNSVGSCGFVEELPDAEGPTDYPGHEDPMVECLSDPHTLDNFMKDFNVLTDIYWPDSLGPLDLDIPSSKYRGEDIILGDSLGGLNRLIASSLDALQNCSFFGLDKKEPTPTAEARETTSLSDFKIGSQG